VRAGCEAAKVPRFTSHGIRRMVATELLMAGNDAKSVSDLTGHTVMTLLRFYSRPTRTRLREMVSRLALTTKTLRRGKVVGLDGAQVPGTESGDID